MVTSTSGWQAWQIRIRAAPLHIYSLPWLWTLVTSGQVALRAARPRVEASSSTLRATPWALNTVTAWGGTSDRSSTKIAPLFFRLSTTYLLCTISCRTYTGGPYFSSARSTISMARTTPAQNPRGWARITFISLLNRPLAGPRLLWTAYNGESPSRGSLADQLDHVPPGIPAKRREHLGDNAFGVEPRLCIHRGRGIL